MSWLGKIFGSGIKEVADAVGGVVDQFVTTEEERAAARLEIEKILAADRAQREESLRQELASKERVLVAELSQGDSYTKRARPTVVYAGLLFILFNYVIAPLFLPNQQSLALPAEFWMGWSGIVATWSIGRSFEKRGVSNKATQSLTGSNRISLLD